MDLGGIALSTLGYVLRLLAFLTLLSSHFISDLHLSVGLSRAVSISHGYLEVKDRSILDEVSQRHHLVDVANARTGSLAHGITESSGLLELLRDSSEQKVDHDVLLELARA